MNHNLREIIQAFDLDPEGAEFQLLSHGLIHLTYRVQTKTADYILQQVNRGVFADVPSLMNNISTVLGVLHQIPIPPPQDYPLLLTTKTGQSFYLDEYGEYWRLYSYVTGTEATMLCSNLSQAREAGLALARFQSYLRPIDVSQIVVTIPNFHDLKYRFKQFQSAVSLDALGLVPALRSEVEYIFSLESWIDSIQEEVATLPVRIQHNDGKFNNILFNSLGQAVCMVDYDTIMPGNIIYDFGELARTVACNISENDPRYLEVRVRGEYLIALFDGYLSLASAWLTDSENELIKFAPAYMTLIISLRFLTDYLNGNKYFNVNYLEQNRDRGLNQLYLFRAFL